MNNMNTSPTISELRVKFVAGTYTPLDAYRDARAIIDANNVDINAYLEVLMMRKSQQKQQLSVMQRKASAHRHSLVCRLR